MSVQFNVKTFFCAILSLGVYLFPVPGLHLTDIWGNVLIKAWHSNLITTVSLSLLILFALFYQLFVLFSLYKLSSQRFTKAIMMGLPVIAGLYVLLVIGVYLVGFAGMAIEQMMGISPI